MKHIGFVYTSDQQMEQMIHLNELHPDREYLVRIHTCIHDAISAMALVHKILKLLPKAKIIGSSTSGVIYGGEILPDSCVISITEFENANVNTYLTIADRNTTCSELAERVAENAISVQSQFMLAFAAYMFTDPESFVDRINEIAPQLQIIGGIANTSSQPLPTSDMPKSFVFHEHGVSNNALAYAVIDAKAMSIHSDIIYVTEPVGDVHVITEADGNIIRTIDGEDAVQWYERMLGIDLNDREEWYNITVVFPLVKPDRGDFPWAVNYSPQNEEVHLFENESNPVLYVPTIAKAGEQIRIAYSSLQKTIETCESVCERMRRYPSEVLFGYSCVSRQDMFRNCAKWELLPFRKTNLCGALVAGEIGNYKGKNRFCNYSFAITALSESGRKMPLDTEALKQHAGELANSQENIIDYLLRKVNKGDTGAAADQQMEIKNRLFMDHNTGLENITKFQFDYNLKLFDKVCMITIRNEGLLKAFLSSSRFLAGFNYYHNAINEYLDDESYHCYVYKETALLITALPEISDNDFRQKMMALQNALCELKFFNYVPVCEFSLVLHEENPVEKAELALIRMRNRKTLFMTYTPELGLEQLNVQKMKMIRIINDAITNNRVIPFFQGIRDNKTGEITLYESLMRLEDEEGNVYSPFHFLDIAREYGYYPDLSYIMIQKVLHAFRDRTDAVTVNMNINDVYNYKIVHSILEFLQNAPHPENYIFELTETEEIEDYQVIAEFAEQIHEAGGKIAIDDFGSGFSNIVNIFKINSDIIKIDGEIIRNICSDIYALEFVEIIAKWATHHQKRVVAEFVENEEIQELVSQNSIRYSQGYLYSKPARHFM